MNKRWLVILFFLVTVFICAQTRYSSDATSISVTPSEQRISILEFDQNGKTRFLIHVTKTNGELVFALRPDGSMEQGSGYNANEQAQKFWQALAISYPQICHPEKIKSQSGSEGGE